MSSQANKRYDRSELLAELKSCCGPKIEDHRLLSRMSQARLAEKIGIGVRWLREIEMGSPKPHLDDYIRCAHGVGLSTTHIFLSVLLLEHRRQIPRSMFFDDLTEIEEAILKFIASDL